METFVQQATIVYKAILLPALVRQAATPQQQGCHPVLTAPWENTAHKTPQIHSVAPWDITARWIQHQSELSHAPLESLTI
ncbi:hypothetical protein DPMN_185108 [Dreissena polymorpha]|uniref:Uncharacterized protein n=1 Tax=Dreissena polymorpha TaxID=45954 RepID=A0A9D4I583_DREPO|nr:hypothetical protein DPMN_185108 [Dreissena polymorpha]